MIAPAPTGRRPLDTRFHAGETVFGYHSPRAASVLTDTLEHAPVNLRWLDTGICERCLPKSVESARKHQEWAQEQKKARAR